MFHQTKLINSNRFILSVGTVALLTVAMVTSTPFANADASDNKPAAQPVDHSKMAGMSGMKDKDMGGMKHMEGMSMTGDVDYDYAVNMRMHHQMAVDMSQAQLKNGKSPKLRSMATNIIAAQKKEITVLDQWIKANKKPVMKSK